MMKQVLLWMIPAILLFAGLRVFNTFDPYLGIALVGISVASVFQLTKNQIKKENNEEN